MTRITNSFSESLSTARALLDHMRFMHCGYEYPSGIPQSGREQSYSRAYSLSSIPQENHYAVSHNAQSFCPQSLLIKRQRGETNRKRVKEFVPFCIPPLVPSAWQLLKPREVEEKWLSLLTEACSAPAEQASVFCFFFIVVVVAQNKSAAWPICGGRVCEHPCTLSFFELANEQSGRFPPHTSPSPLLAGILYGTNCKW